MTFLLDYAGQRFLVNPVMEETPGNEKPAVAFGELLDVDAVISTRLSPSSFDRAARRLIPRGMKVFVPNQEDVDVLEKDGFSNLEVLTEKTEFCHLGVRRMPSYQSICGTSVPDEKSCGVMIFHPVLNSVYIAGRTVWNDEIKKILKSWKPRSIVTSAGFREKEGRSRFGMDREEIAAIHLSYPRAKIIVSNRPDTAEEYVSREDIRSYVAWQRMEEALLFPKDGEQYRL